MLPKRKWIILTAVASAVTMFILTTLLYMTPIGKTVYFAVADMIGGTDYSKLYAIERIIDDTYYEKLDKEQMSEMAAAGYVEGVGDVYTEYMTAEYLETAMSGMEDENYHGIGIEISQAEEKIMIISVMENSPAAKAGIVADDFILAVNGTNYTYEQVDTAISQIKSTKDGETVTLTIERSGEVFDVEVIVETIEIKNVTYKMIDSNIGYIRIKTFGETVSEDFEEAAESLLNSGMKALVIDVRSNPGGLLESVVEIVDYLVPEGTITTIKYKDSKNEVYTSDANHIGIPMAVLVNETSASASEVMAGALKDFNAATLVGKKTYGKGVVQGIYELGDGSAVKVTVARYYTPSDVCIDKIGINPDVEVDLPDGKSIGNFDINFDGDTQFQKAVEVLNKDLGLNN